MKLPLLIGFVLLCTLPSKAQSKKWANAIEITANVPDSTLMESTISVFEDQGYVVLKSDTKRGTIVTDHKSIGVAACGYWAT